MKRISLAIFVLGASLFVGGAAHGGATSDCAPGGDYLETYELTLTPAKTVYRHGETAQIEVKVERVLHDHRSPVKGASVILGLENQDVMLATGGFTNGDGTTVLDVKIARRMPVGLADVRAHASTTHASVPCYRAGEEGRFDQADFLQIVR